VAAWSRTRLSSRVESCDTGSAKAWSISPCPWFSRTISCRRASLRPRLRLPGPSLTSSILRLVRLVTAGKTRILHPSLLAAGNNGAQSGSYGMLALRRPSLVLHRKINSTRATYFPGTHIHTCDLLSSIASASKAPHSSFAIWRKKSLSTNIRARSSWTITAFSGKSESSGQGTSHLRPCQLGNGGSCRKRQSMSAWNNRTSNGE
jgi:hypothetical protein